MSSQEFTVDYTGNSIDMIWEKLNKIDKRIMALEEPQPNMKKVLRELKKDLQKEEKFVLDDIKITQNDYDELQEEYESMNVKK